MVNRVSVQTRENDCLLLSTMDSSRLEHNHSLPISCVVEEIIEKNYRNGAGGYRKRRGTGALPDASVDPLDEITVV